MKASALQPEKLTAREKARLEEHLALSKKPVKKPLGIIPPFVVPPLLPYLPKEWLVWENSGSGAIAETIRKLNGNVVIESIQTLATFDAIVAAPQVFADVALHQAFATLKPFALLMPLSTLGMTVPQQLFQQYGMSLLLMDKQVSTYHWSLGWETPMTSYAWFCWSMPNMHTNLSYAHVPDMIRLPSWMVRPKTLKEIQKAEVRPPGARTI